MTTATAQADRIPLADLEALVTAALSGGDYVADFPPEHVVTASILTAGLKPDTDGTVDKQQAAASILSVITARLGMFPHYIRAHSLVRRLTEEAEAYEGKAEDTGVRASDCVLRCQACGGELPAGSRPSRRTCSDRCRAALMRTRRKGRR